MPLQNYSEAMEFTQQEWNNGYILNHIFHGINTDGLIDTWRWGCEEHLKKIVNSVPGAGVICTPTALGAELLLWAFGHGDKGLNFLLTGDFSSEIEGIPKSVSNSVATQSMTNNPS